MLPRLIIIITFFLSSAAIASAQTSADGIATKTTYAKEYGPTQGQVMVDPARDLPRYPAVEPKEAPRTWQVKKGFKLELVAHEPLVRDPIALCFDERGRMFACEMIDYSEMRDVIPHLGRISMLEDKDGDGFFETSTVFADNLPWPTGLTWVNGGLYVGATPDIWRLEDKDGDGKAELREKVFTGFGTGLRIINVQGMLNSFQWGQDNKVHVLAGGGNRGKIKCLKRSDLPELELGGKDFWFDPLTYEFGMETGGAQYGMSFDDYGRKFGCSNSDHLQYWLYDDRYAAHNPFYELPPSRRSIAADGGAAEVFRISPDEPWRIIRTRWRIAGVVKGAVEGGGRVSGYFTGATGTTIYRGDAYGPEFVNNSFTGDAGGQLIHRKMIRYANDGINLVGERPADEHGFEFAASRDTWVRVVNFANAPDGCLYVCDMYREVIEHPWSIPDEIKQHLDLNSGNERGRIWRIEPTTNRAERIGQKVTLAEASTEELVKILSHPNGWHRDTAQRLLHERRVDASYIRKSLTGNENAKRHALSLLSSSGSLTYAEWQQAAQDSSDQIRLQALRLANPKSVNEVQGCATILEQALKDPVPAVRYQALLTIAHLAKTLPTTIQKEGNFWRMIDEVTDLAADPHLTQELAHRICALPTHAVHLILKLLAERQIRQIPPGLIRVAFADLGTPSAIDAYVQHLKKQWAQPALIRAAAEGAKRAGTSLQVLDKAGHLASAFSAAALTAQNQQATESSRIEAIDLLRLATKSQAEDALIACLKTEPSVKIQTAAVKALAEVASFSYVASIQLIWPSLKAEAREAALVAILSRDAGALALLREIQNQGAAKVWSPTDLSASQIQAMVNHKNNEVATLAKTVLKSVIPPSREEVTKTYAPAIGMKGDAQAGQNHYISRCMACHEANGMGIEVGPKLTTVKNKGREALLEAILQPHKEVASQYIAYTVNTKDGQTVQGIITADDASSMTIKMMGGAQVTLPRASIQSSSSGGQSLMPEGLEGGLSVQDMADLLSFIETVN